MTETYRVAFANVQLVVEGQQEQWGIRILDLSERETLYTSTMDSLPAAKTAAVHAALGRLFGPDHGKASDKLAQSLAWESGFYNMEPTSPN